MGSGTFYVEDGLDDAAEYGDATFNNSDTLVRIQSYADPGVTNYRCGGFRFPNVTVPKDAVITSMTIQVYAYSESYDSINVELYGNDVDDADDFDVLQSIISEVDRPRTTTSVSWVEADMGIGWAESPDLADIGNEIFARAGWSSGNALVLLFIANTNNTTIFRPYSFDQDSQYAAILTIEWISPNPLPVQVI